jgi:hypothetical protein
MVQRYNIRISGPLLETTKEQFGPDLDLEIRLNDSEAAQGHVLRGSTTVLVNGQWVPLDVAT